MPGQASAEKNLILQCVRTDVKTGAPNVHLVDLLSGPLDWTRVLDLCLEQSVLPLVHRTLSNAYPELVPTGVLEQMASQRLATSQYNLSLTSLLFEALDRLEQKGVDALPLKGPTLALQLYGDVGLRTFGDLDLLVRPADLAAARSAFEAGGFTSVYRPSSERRALLLKHGSHESFERDSHVVELHWRIAARSTDFAMDYDDLWRSRRELPVANRTLMVLAPTELLLVLCIHGSKHGWERLAWICDVAELLHTQDIAWVRLWQKAEKMECTRVVGLGLRLAVELIGARLPDAEWERVQSDRTIDPLMRHVRRNLFRSRRAGAGDFGFHLATRAGWRAKLRLAWDGLTSLNQRDVSVVALPAGLAPLYYGIRAGRLIGKAVQHALPKHYDRAFSDDAIRESPAASASRGVSM